MDATPTTVLLLGNGNVGKSTFLSRISRGAHALEGDSDVTSTPLLCDADQPFVFELQTRRGGLRLELYDTAGPESWTLLRPDVVILCYDISHRPSLVDLQRNWIKEVRTRFLSRDHIPVIVLGLKRDLRSQEDPNGVIYPQEALRIAQEMMADRYVECSALTGELLGLAFEEICRTALRTTDEADGGRSEPGCVVM